MNDYILMTDSSADLPDKLVRELTIVYETCALPEDRLYVSWSAAGAGGVRAFQQDGFPITHIYKG